MTKRADSIKALREMNDDELAEHLRQQRRRLFEIRFQQATGQVENHRLVREVRREIARTMTVQIEAAGMATSWPEARAPQPSPPPRTRKTSDETTAEATQEPESGDEVAEETAPEEPKEEEDSGE